MKNPFDYFEKIFLINLDKRTDRWESAQKELDKVGILDRTKRFSAIEDTTNGAIGCAGSHITIIKTAKLGGWKTVLILEDDVCFLDNTLEVLDKVVKDLKRYDYWEMLYLGLNPLRKMSSISPNLLKVNGAYTTHAYAVSSRFYETILAKPVVPIDVHYSRLHVRHKNIFAVNPMIASQSNSHSDIENAILNNGPHIESRFKQFLP